MTTKPIDPKRFAHPRVNDRPGVRWWWQSAVSTDALIKQLIAIADAGFGEVEIAFSHGFWGDERERHALGIVLREAECLGVGVAMTAGASWPLQTPNTTTGTGLSTRELQYGAVQLPREGTERVHVPYPIDDPEGERPSTLVRVIAVRVVSAGERPTVVTTEYGTALRHPVIRPPRVSTLLDARSSVDLTAQVAASTIPWAQREGDWQLLAFWMRDCEQAVTNVLDGAATKAASAYLDHHQIGADNTELLTRVGTDLFEDSLELNADSLFWTSDMPDRFAERHGYDLTPYLPVLFAHGMSTYWVPNDEPTPDFDFGSGIGARVRRDYYRLLTDLYVSEHLLVMQDWARRHGLRHKSQAAYGQNLEPIRSNRELARAGGRPEAESLNAGDRAPISRSDATWRFALDSHRSIVGGAHQGGAVRISTELGAQFRAAYALTLGDLQQMLAKEWAAGITRPFVHGVATQDAHAPWPTQNRFWHIVSDSWNEDHFPEWANWRPLTEYWARGTVVLETGTPRTDVAIYRDGFLTTAARGVRDPALDATAPACLADTESLERIGFTVQFIDPIGLAEPTTVAGDGTLYPDGPAYRALIIDERSLPPEAAEAVALAAERGLRVVFVGALPSSDSGFAHERVGDDRVRAAIARAVTMPSAVRVHSMADAGDALQRLALIPRVKIDDQPLLTQWREAGSCHYVLVYNTLSEPVDADLSLEGSGRVHELDLASGRILTSPHSAKGGRTIVPTRIPALSVRVFELDLLAQPNTVIDARRSARDDVSTEGWRLRVESEQPGGPRTIELEGVGPCDWREIDALARVSGVGTYTFRVDPNAAHVTGRRATIELGALAGSAVVRVGGRDVGTAYVNDSLIELGATLAPGTEIEIEVRTALRNAVIASGISDLFDENSSVPHGLIGPVRVSIARV